MNKDQRRALKQVITALVTDDALRFKQFQDNEFSRDWLTDTGFENDVRRLICYIKNSCQRSGYVR